MANIYTDGRYFWYVDEYDNAEIMDDIETFTLRNKIALGLARETTTSITIRGFDKVLFLIEEDV